MTEEEPPKKLADTYKHSFGYATPSVGFGMWRNRPDEKKQVLWLSLFKKN